MQNNKTQHVAKEILAQKFVLLSTNNKLQMHDYVLWDLYNLQWRMCQIKMQSLTHIQMFFNTRNLIGWNKWRSNVLATMSWAIFQNYLEGLHWEMNLAWSWEGQKIELDINAEYVIHTAVRQTELLIKERVKQFWGLVGMWGINCRFGDTLYF